MVLKHHSPPNASSTCYIERLPPEVANLICYPIDEEDVPNLRLVSKFWNNVATPFLPGKVNLIFKPESFQRLLDISRHPVISKQITSLYYEPNTLDEYTTQKAWEENIFDSNYLKDLEAYPSPDASERKLRAWRRNITKIRERPRHDYSKSYLEVAYKEYTQMYAEQEDLRNRDCGLKEVSDAIYRLPNLSEICMNHGWAICLRPKDAKNAFAAGLHNAGGDYCGIPFMRSLLLAVHEAGTKLSILQLGSVDWKFLQQSDEILESMKSTLRHLTTLELAISTGIDESGNEIGVEIPACRRYLSKNTKLAEFLAAAPNLKDLTVGFDWYEPYCPAELKQILGSTTWPCLESVALENIDAAPNNLNCFFEQHASTLKHVAMKTVRLQEGIWVNTLEEMQKTLNLKSAYMRGDLLGENPPQHWDLEPDIWAEYNDLRSQGNRTSKAVQDFLVQGGSCPLIDEDAHPQRGW